MMNALFRRMHDWNTPHPDLPPQGGKGKEKGTARYMPTRISQHMRRRARELRMNMTPPERLLWEALRDLNRFEGARFRRQTAIGPYVVDFVSFRHGLVIEVDGETHVGEGAARRDAKRDAFLAGEGFEVVRFSNRQVVQETAAVLETIYDKIRTGNSLPPCGGGVRGGGSKE